MSKQHKTQLRYKPFSVDESTPDYSKVTIHFQEGERDYANEVTKAQIKRLEDHFAEQFARACARHRWIG